MGIKVLGLAITSDLLQQRPWPGSNRMGTLLMKVRNDIRIADEAAAIPPPQDRMSFDQMDVAGTVPTATITRPSQGQSPPRGTHRIQQAMMAIADTEYANIDRRTVMNLANASYDETHSVTMDTNATDELEEGEYLDTN